MLFATWTTWLNQMRRFSGQRLIASSKPARRDRGFPVAGIELLERRDLLAAGITAKINVENGRNILDVAGTEKADTIYIEYSPNTGIFYVGSKFDGEDIGKFRDVHEIRVNGAGGDDRIDLGRNPPKVKAILSGGPGKDKLIGGDGDDHLDGGDGDDTLIGGRGADLMVGQKGKDLLLGEDGNDVMYGGGGGSTPESGGKDADKLFGGPGDDSIWGGGGADTLYGGEGGDSLYGGSDKDTLMGESGFDYLYGNAGIDRLFGEFEKTGGKSGAENWLEAGAVNEKGAATEVATDGFNAFKPVVDGMKFSDIDQVSGNSCSALSSLAAAAKSGSLTDKQIVYKGNFTYSLRFFNPDPDNITQGKEIFVDVKFDGAIAEFGTKRLDPGTPNYEFWTSLYLRGYFQLQHGFDYVKTPQDLNKFGGENAAIPLARIIPHRTGRLDLDKDGDDSNDFFTEDELQSVIANGKAVTAALGVESGKETSYHSYMISRIYTGTWDGEFDSFVELYNPWGTSKLNGDGTINGEKVDIFKSNTPGLFSVRWSDFVQMVDNMVLVL